MSRVFMASMLCVALICCVGETSESVPDFAGIKNEQEKKKVFFCYLAPLLQKQNEQLMKTRGRLTKILEEFKKSGKLGGSDGRFVEGLAKEYGVAPAGPDEKTVARLLIHVDEVPNSLGLAQAANESAWGTSRFAREGHNFFGQWCFEEGCGLVPAKRPAGRTYEVRRFSNVQDSVNAFMLNLNQNEHYEALRKIRAEERKRGESLSGLAMAEGLRGYSARGQEYVHTLQSMIRFNHLSRFDTEAGIKQVCAPPAAHAQGGGNADPMGPPA